MIWMIPLFIVFVAGCQQAPQETRYTEITTEASKTLPQAIDMGANEDPHAGLDMGAMPEMELPVVMNLSYSWQAPEGWTQSKGSGMRLASFHVTAEPEALDCSVISLAGEAGGLEANLTRWMGQIGLKADASDLTVLMTQAASLKTKGGNEGRVYDLTTLKAVGSSDKSMVVVMLPVGHETLFVKMTGTVDVLKKYREDFFELVASIEHKDAAAVSADPHAGLDLAKDPHAGMDMAAMSSMMGAPAGANQLLAWTLPEGWKEEGPSSMRLATFRLAADPAVFDCSVISLGGPAGGLEANLLRWAAQLGLNVSGQDIMSRLDMVKTKDGMEARVIDFSIVQTAASSNDKSMLAAIISVDASTVFIKMNASLETVKQQKEAFMTLIRSVSRK